MLDITKARKDLAKGHVEAVAEFLNEVEILLRHNKDIKQVPALFKPPVKGS